MAMTAKLPLALSLGLGLSLASPALAGSVLGTMFNRRVKGASVRRLFAILLVAMAVQMFYRVFTTGAAT